MQKRYLKIILVLLILTPPIFPKKKPKLLHNKTELPQGLWSGITENNKRLTVSFCPNNTYLEIEGDKKTNRKITFRMYRDKGSLIISLHSAKDNKWIGETLMYQKKKGHLFLKTDNGESELTPEDWLPMRQVSNECETCFVAPALLDRGLQVDNGAQQYLQAARTTASLGRVLGLGHLDCLLARH